MHRAYTQRAGVCGGVGGGSVGIGVVRARRKGWRGGGPGTRKRLNLSETKGEERNRRPGGGTWLIGAWKSVCTDKHLGDPNLDIENRRGCQ